MSKELKQHPYGFEYTPIRNSDSLYEQVSVTEEERIRYTKSKPITFKGIEIENDREYKIYIEDFTQCIKDGGKFYQTDMFGKEVSVTKEELKRFIDGNYLY